MECSIYMVVGGLSQIDLVDLEERSLSFLREELQHPT